MFGILCSYLFLTGMKPELVLNSFQKQTRFRNRLVGPYRYKKSKGKTSDKNEAKLTHNPENNKISFNDGKRNIAVDDTKKWSASSTHQHIIRVNEMDIPNRALLTNATISFNAGIYRNQTRWVKLRH